MTATQKPASVLIAAVTLPVCRSTASGGTSTMRPSGSRRLTTKSPAAAPAGMRLRSNTRVSVAGTRNVSPFGSQSATAGPTDCASGTTVIPVVSTSIVTVDESAPRGISREVPSSRPDVTVTVPPASPMSAVVVGVTRLRSSQPAVTSASNRHAATRAGGRTGGVDIPGQLTTAMRSSACTFDSRSGTTSTILPSFVARTTVSIFIASRVRMGSPSLMSSPAAQCTEMTVPGIGAPI